MHIFKDFYPPLAAGITRYIADVADATARHGHEVEVHVAGVRTSRRDQLPSGVVVHRHREIGRALSMPLALGLARAGRGLDCDVVHVHMPNPIGEWAALQSSAPIIATFHAQLGRQRFLQPFYGPLQRALIHRAASVIVSSDRMAEAPELQAVPERLVKLPYGVSPRLADQHLIDRRSDDVLKVLFVGRLVYYKGVDILLEALAKTASTTLTIVGEGPLRAELGEQATHLRVADRVRFLGGLSDDALLQTYLDHDVFVLPSVSRAEAFGLAMAEAMATGLPAISTCLGTGTDWVNQAGLTGLVVPPGDAEALGRAISQLQNPTLRHALGNGAWKRASEDLSFETHLNSLLDLYSDAAETHRPR